MVVPLPMLRNCLPIIGLALIAIGALTWAIMALRRSLARERRLARVDDLTGVRNARAFREAAGAQNERARRYQHPLRVAGVGPGFPGRGDPRGFPAPPLRRGAPADHRGARPRPGERL